MRRVVSVSLLALSAGVYASTALALTHTDKTVEVVHSPDTRECVFFRLTGVTQADPVTPGVSWFAVPKTHAGYKEIVAILLQARATGAPLQHVATTGAVACGHAEVSSLSL